MIIDVNNLKHSNTELCELMISNGSDKAGGWHNYTLVYNELFKELKKSVKNVFELGLGITNLHLEQSLQKSGASIKSWKEYFIKANIYGADINKNLLFEEKRIKTYYCDQTSKESIKELWDKLNKVQFDIIIEDGLHTYQSNIIFLENSLHKVKKDGFYIIEDLSTKDLYLYKEYFKKTKLIFSKYQLIELPNEGNKLDNNMIIIKV